MNFEKITMGWFWKKFENYITPFLCINKPQCIVVLSSTYPFVWDGSLCVGILFGDNVEKVSFFFFFHCCHSNRSTLIAPISWQPHRRLFKDNVTPLCDFSSRKLDSDVNWSVHSQIFGGFSNEWTCGDHRSQQMAPPHLWTLYFYKRSPYELA